MKPEAAQHRITFEIMQRMGSDRFLPLILHQWQHCNELSKAFKISCVVR